MARFWLDAKLRKRHFDFGRLSILARRIVPCPTFFLARALEDTSLCVYIWLAVPLAQVIRDVEPPLPLLPMGRSPVFGINKHFRKQPFASMRNAVEQQIQIFLVMLETNSNVPVVPDADGDRLGILPFTRCDLSIDRNGVTTRNGDENTFLLPLVFRNDTPNRSAVRRPFGNQAK